MATQTITISVPDHLYLRLEQTAEATQQSVTDILVQAVEIGSPPSWEDVPPEFQVELAALDRLNDKTLWRIARGQQSEAEMDRYEELLHKNANNNLTATEQNELDQLRYDADRFMLRKAHAAALLRWRGHQLPPAEKL